jgi:L-alanine-DL-glutamate epimerase-like enolase superfamily enzyme
LYAAGGYYVEGKGVRELVKEMEGYVSEGFRAVKMKVGGGATAAASGSRTRCAWWPSCGL